MYGYTSQIPVFTRLQNLAEQLPENIRAIALGQCCEDNPYDFERVLTGFVMTWNDDKAEQERQAAEASEITDELLGDGVQLKHAPTEFTAFGSVEWYENVKPIEY